MPTLEHIVLEMTDDENSRLSAAASSVVVAASKRERQSSHASLSAPTTPTKAKPKKRRVSPTVTEPAEQMSKKSKTAGKPAEATVVKAGTSIKKQAPLLGKGQTTLGAFFKVTSLPSNKKVISQLVLGNLSTHKPREPTVDKSKARRALELVGDDERDMQTSSLTGCRHVKKSSEASPSNVKEDAEILRDSTEVGQPASDQSHHEGQTVLGLSTNEGALKKKISDAISLSSDDDGGVGGDDDDEGGNDPQTPMTTKKSTSLQTSTSPKSAESFPENDEIDADAKVDPSARRRQLFSNVEEVLVVGSSDDDDKNADDFVTEDEAEPVKKEMEVPLPGPRKKQAAKRSVKRAASPPADARSTLSEPKTPSAKTSADEKTETMPTPPKKSKTAAKAATKTLPVSELSNELRSLFLSYKKSKEACKASAAELIETAKQGIEGESPEAPSLLSCGGEEDSDGNADEFSDRAIQNIAIMIEGSTLPLSELTNTVLDSLEKYHGRKYSAQAVSEQVKTMAKRKDVFGAPGSVDIFEDTDPNRFWRWELTSAELLPSDLESNVRKARSARSKLSRHHVALTKLTKALDSAMSKIRQDPPLDQVKLDKLKADISRGEEKVLKFKREAEKTRLAEVAKRKKVEEQEQKKRDKEAEQEKRRKEKERKIAEAAEAKKQKQKEKESKDEAKRQKLQEKENVKEQKQMVKQHRTQVMEKQKACMMSFFGKAPKNNHIASIKATDSIPAESPTKLVEPAEPSDPLPSGPEQNTFNVRAFRRAVNSRWGEEFSEPLFPTLTHRAKASRKGRTQKVRVSVFVTKIPDNPFEAQPYAEERILTVPNKNRFLSFSQDYRPPYWGTWSKTSKIVNGRNPFAKDTSYLDYDVDSEAEWEEGDDEIGEDVEDDEKNMEDDMDDEEGDPSMYNYKDGFCVADDEYLATDADVDEDTKLLYEKKLKNAGATVDCRPNVVRIVSPIFGGLPFEKTNSAASGRLEDLEPKLAQEIIDGHQGQTLCDFVLDLNAYDGRGDANDSSPNSGGANASASKKTSSYTKEDLQTMARFVHHTTLASKERLVSELQIQHPDTFSNRAKALRKLDLIAEKRRRHKGVFWEIKPSVRVELGLDDELAKEFPEELPLPSSEKPTSTDKASAMNACSTDAAQKPNDSQSPHQPELASTTSPSPTSVKTPKKKRRIPLITIGDSLASCIAEPMPKKQKIADVEKDEAAAEGAPKPPVHASPRIMARFLNRSKPSTA